MKFLQAINNHVNQISFYQIIIIFTLNGVILHLRVITKLNWYLVEENRKKI